MLFQPTNVIPSTLSGEGAGTIDATKPLNVSWQVNGKSPMVAYRIKIMQNDTESTLKLDTGKVTLSTPFYGNDALGNPKAYSVNIASSQMSTAGIINGYSNGYKMTIQQWWTVNDSVEQTSASYFITRAAPTVTLAIIPYRNSFRQQEHTFEAYYSQAQGDAIEWNRWELQAKQNGVYETVDDTGFIYNAGLVPNYYYDIIQYTYNGFCIGNYETGESVGVSYRIKCTVQTENGVHADTGWIDFTTQVLGSQAPEQVTIGLCVTRDTDGVKITMPKNFPILGNANGGYSYTASATKFDLTLPSASSVTWGGSGEASLNIREKPYYISVKAKITNSSANTAFLIGHYLNRTLRFGCNHSKFYIDLDGQIIWQKSIPPVNGAVFGITLMDETVFFLMKNGTTVTTDEASIEGWQGDELQSLSIHGPMQFCDVVINEGNRIWFEFYNHVTSDYAATSYFKKTLFIASFDYTLYTGAENIGASGTGRNGNPPVLTNTLAVYRKEKSSILFQLVADMSLNEHTRYAEFYDYGAKNLTEYEYYLMYLWGSKYARDRNNIGTITPCFWNYTVLCCSQNNLGDYIVEKEYRFGLDVSTNNMGNNNSPTLQQNFTQYPLRQPVSNNYRSGSLSAYIGKVENDKYVDSTNKMDELYALSVNPLTKFLKTRKGQIFQIETSAPVAMSIGDKYAQQPAKISLPWVEVGNASNANILGDTSFILDTPTFSVDPETMELTMEYSNASSMGAGSFALVDSDLYLLDPGVYDESDFSLNGNMEVILDTNSGGEG